MPSATGIVTKTYDQLVSIMLQRKLQGEQQQAETEMVPDNYPYRLPPLSGRREDTQSNMGTRNSPDITAQSITFMYLFIKVSSTKTYSAKHMLLSNQFSVRTIASLKLYSFNYSERFCDYLQFIKSLFPVSIEACQRMLTGLTRH